MMMMMISRPTMINDLPGFGDGEWAGERERVRLGRARGQETELGLCCWDGALAAVLL